MLSQALFMVLTSFIMDKTDVKKIKTMAPIFIFPIFLLLTACNDSNDDQAASPPDGSKTPVMRCAP
ncbi:hypothetical protein [Acinetobacter sp.]|uniref:hypothetical protein n=1 Tax=Acinetobacter sp. TaxID=472 RepID=UPI0035AD92BD